MPSTFATNLRRFGHRARKECVERSLHSSHPEYTDTVCTYEISLQDESPLNGTKVVETYRKYHVPTVARDSPPPPAEDEDGYVHIDVYHSKDYAEVVMYDKTWTDIAIIVAMSVMALVFLVIAIMYYLVRKSPYAQAFAMWNFFT